MNGFQAYGIILAIVLTDPATIGAAGAILTRYRGIRRAGARPLRVLSWPFSRALEQRATSDKIVSVQTASARAGKAQTNETA
jgi:hypothetical protein